MEWKRDLSWPPVNVFFVVVVSGGRGMRIFNQMVYIDIPFGKRKRKRERDKTNHGYSRCLAHTTSPSTHLRFTSPFRSSNDRSLGSGFLGRPLFPRLGISVGVNIGICLWEWDILEKDCKLGSCSPVMFVGRVRLVAPVNN